MSADLYDAACHLDSILYEKLKANLGTDRPVLSEAIKEFQETLDPRMSLCDVMNLVIYERWYGNFAHVIGTFVFRTPFYLRHFEEEEEEEEEDCFMSEPQVQDALHTTFRLIIDHGLMTDVVDYYFTKPMHGVVSNGDPIPDRLFKYISSFKFLMKNGAKIVELQQKHVRAWLVYAFTKREAIKNRGYDHQ